MTYAERKIDTYSEELHMPTFGQVCRDGDGSWCFRCEEGKAEGYYTTGHPTCLHAITDGSSRACCTGLALLHPDLVAVGHEINGGIRQWEHMLSRDAADMRQFVARKEWFRHGRKAWMWMRAMKIVNAGY